MSLDTYITQRAKVEEYFDRTAADTWDRLTSDAPVSRIRAQVRAGREQMRQLMLSWLPLNLHGKRILDAGCGTGTMAVELARRGAHVIAVDLSSTLITIAQSRYKSQLDSLGPLSLDEIHRRPSLAEAMHKPQRAGISWITGDLADPILGHFDYVVSMDCLIHYRLDDMLQVLSNLAQRCSERMLLTFAPSSSLLQLMHWTGRLFPRRDRSPNIQPIRAQDLHQNLRKNEALRHWAVGRQQRVSASFYTSEALELVNPRAAKFQSSQEQCA